MANQKHQGESYEFITVDTAPGADGYWTNPVMARNKGQLDRLFLSARDEDESTTASATVTLQYRYLGDTVWQTYVDPNIDEYVVGERYLIEVSGS